MEVTECSFLCLDWYLFTRRNLCLPEILSQTFHRKKVCDEICTSTYLTTNSNFGNRFLPHTNAIVKLKNCDTRNSFKRAFYSLCEWQLFYICIMDLWVTHSHSHVHNNWSDLRLLQVCSHTFLMRKDLQKKSVSRKSALVSRQTWPNFGARKCIKNLFTHLTFWDEFALPINLLKNSKSATKFEDPANLNQIFRIKEYRISEWRVVIGSIVICGCPIFTIRYVNCDWGKFFRKLSISGSIFIDHKFIPKC